MGVTASAVKPADRLSIPKRKKRIDANLEKILPELRPEAQKTIAKKGYLSERTRAGLPLLRIQDGWCVFFNQGCVLHKIGAAEGDKYRYKPVACALPFVER